MTEISPTPPIETSKPEKRQKIGETKIKMRDIDQFSLTPPPVVKFTLAEMLGNKSAGALAETSNFFNRALQSEKFAERKKTHADIKESIDELSENLKDNFETIMVLVMNAPTETTSLLQYFINKLNAQNFPVPTLLNYSSLDFAGLLSYPIEFYFAFNLVFRQRAENKDWKLLIDRSIRRINNLSTYDYLPGKYELGEVIDDEMIKLEAVLQFMETSKKLTKKEIQQLQLSVLQVMFQRNYVPGLFKSEMFHDPKILSFVQQRIKELTEKYADVAWNRYKYDHNTVTKQLHDIKYSIDGWTALLKKYGKNTF